MTQQHVKNFCKVGVILCLAILFSNTSALAAHMATRHCSDLKVNRCIDSSTKESLGNACFKGSGANWAEQGSWTNCNPDTTGFKTCKLYQYKTMTKEGCEGVDYYHCW